MAGVAIPMLLNRLRTTSFSVPMMIALEPAIPNIAPIGKHKNKPEAAMALSEGLIEACKAINTAPCAMPVPRPLRELAFWM